MAISREKKSAIVEKLDGILAEASSLAFVRFHKLRVADTATVRKELKKEGVGYYVAKKTLIRRALTQHGYTGEAPEMPGEIALLWSRGDATAPARLIYAAGRKYKEALSLVGGVFEGAFADAAKMLAIATIPPLPQLRGMFVNVINSPIQGLVIALDQIAQKKGT
ncbi:MAG: 50S ribosomal protein L10 [Minisyncoccia bacterium]